MTHDDKKKHFVVTQEHKKQVEMPLMGTQPCDPLSCGLNRQTEITKFPT